MAMIEVRFSLEKETKGALRTKRSTTKAKSSSSPARESAPSTCKSAFERGAAELRVTVETGSAPNLDGKGAVGRQTEMHRMGFCNLVPVVRLIAPQPFCNIRYVPHGQSDRRLAALSHSVWTGVRACPAKRGHGTRHDMRRCSCDHYELLRWASASPR